MVHILKISGFKFTSIIDNITNLYILWSHDEYGYENNHGKGKNSSNTFRTANQ